MKVVIRGVAYRAVTAAEMREMDRRAIEDYGIPGVVLMENAGRGAADRIGRVYRLKKYRGPVIIVCGNGNNGGDGFVIARHLHNAGIAVKVFLVGNEADIDVTSDYGINYNVVKKMKLDRRVIRDPHEFQREIMCYSENGILVDALLGTGLNKEVREPLASIIRTMDQSRLYTVAVDTPSGLDCTTGKALGCAVRADETVTFGLPKAGFFKGDGPKYVGRLRVVDIGLPREILQTSARGR